MNDLFTMTPANPKPLLIGMNNPVSTERGHELFPAPEGCTGHRLWRMLHERTSATRMSYLESFERRNLVRSAIYSATVARLNAREIYRELESTGRTIVLLGRSVQVAFNIPPLLVHPQVIGGCTWRQIPHPSGRNLWYNDKKNVKVVELLLEELYRAYHKQTETAQ